ncbi:hypothetical protein INR49_015213 [Caranx melampygus]|nr:hypothetical protein INR49_015213 [Caranx melampygus]
MGGWLQSIQQCGSRVNIHLHLHDKQVRGLNEQLHHFCPESVTKVSLLQHLQTTCGEKETLRAASTHLTTSTGQAKAEVFG